MSETNPTHERDEATQKQPDQDVKEYLETLAGFVAGSVDEIDGDLFIREGYSAPGAPRRFELRVRLDSGGESVVSRPQSLDAGEMEAFLRGVQYTAADYLNAITVNSDGEDA